MRVEELTLDEWEEALPADGFEVFHLPEVLRVLDDHATGDLRLFGGYRGEQLVGLLPVFVRHVWFAKAVVSPPPGMYVHRLGPLLMPSSPKRRKQEKLNRTFTSAVLEALNADDPFTLVGIHSANEYADPRPYLWEGFEVEPRFAYRIPLADSSPDDVLKSFSKSIRREVRDGEERDVSVETRGIDAARQVYRATEARYDEQDVSFPLSWPYTRDIVTALDERARVYVAESSDGEFLGGITVLYSNDAAYFWQGGTRGISAEVNVNGLLHWRIVEDALTDDELSSVEWYDLGNAYEERLSRYKSKFNPELVESYQIQSGKLAALAKEVYARIPY